MTVSSWYNLSECGTCTQKLEERRPSSLLSSSSISDQLNRGPDARKRRRRPEKRRDRNRHKRDSAPNRRDCKRGRAAFHVCSDGASSDSGSSNSGSSNSSSSDSGSSNVGLSGANVSISDADEGFSSVESPTSSSFISASLVGVMDTDTANGSLLSSEGVEVMPSSLSSRCQQPSKVSCDNCGGLYKAGGGLSRHRYYCKLKQCSLRLNLRTNGACSLAYKTCDIRVKARRA
jgi:hypothetical protein